MERRELPPAVLRARLGAAVAVGVGAAMLIAGPFLPWLTASDGVTTGSIDGFHAEGTSGLSPEGFEALVGAGILLIVAVAFSTGRLATRRFTPLVVAAGALAIFPAQDVHASLHELAVELRSNGYQAADGWGWWETIAAAIPLLCAIVLAARAELLLQRERDDLALGAPLDEAAALLLARQRNQSRTIAAVVAGGGAIYGSYAVMHDDVVGGVAGFVVFALLAVALEAGWRAERRRRPPQHDIGT